MENKTTDREWQLVELLETTDFEELTVSEQQMVLQEMTADEYARRRKVVVESGDWIHDEIPLPLILEEEKSGWLIPIPLYQSIAAVASVFLLSFFVFRSSGDVLGETNGSGLVAVDTVYVEKYITDTVIEYDTRYVDRVIVKSNPAAEKVQEDIALIKDESPKRDETLSRALPALPDLSELRLDNNGSSANNDKTTELLEGYSIDR
jgi:hypothetical protein